LGIKYTESNQLIELKKDYNNDNIAFDIIDNEKFNNYNLDYNYYKVLSGKYRTRTLKKNYFLLGVFKNN
jgi:hypothetical protein